MNSSNHMAQLGIPVAVVATIAMMVVPLLAPILDMLVTTIGVVDLARATSA